MSHEAAIDGKMFGLTLLQLHLFALETTHQPYTVVAQYQFVLFLKSFALAVSKQSNL